MDTVTLTLERQDIKSNFKLIAQKIPVQCRGLSQILSTAEKVVNTKCIDSECFSIKVTISIEKYSYYTKDRIDLVTEAILTDVIDYYGNYILKENIKLN